MSEFILALLICSATMSVLALIFMMITPMLTKRYSIQTCYYAWLIVIIGLIIPFRPQWHHSIIRVEVPGNTAVTAAPSTETGHPGGGQYESPAPVAIKFGNNPVRYLPPAVPPYLTRTTGLRSDSAGFPGFSWWQIAAMVWLVGLIVFLAKHGIKHYHFVKTVNRWSERITDVQSLSLLQMLQAEMGIQKPVTLYRCPSIGSPMLTGLRNPRILLPAANLAPDSLCFVLAHELVHYKRKDLYYKCLILIATAIHWFSPIVYLVAKTIDVQCELSCDAEVVKSADPGTRHHYSKTIIDLVRYKSSLKTSLSTNFYSGRKCMKNRIHLIMDTGKKRTGIAIFLVALLIIAGTGFTSFSNSTPGAQNFGQDIKTVGDTIMLGGMDWRILEVKEGKALVLSDKVLTAQSYHASDAAPITWEESHIRRYLNETYYEETFSEQEKMQIVEALILDRDNPWYGMSSGSETTDKLFLLSIDEVLHYFGDSGGLENRQNGISYISDEFSEERLARTQEGEMASWWLRSPGIHYDACEDAHTCAAIVSSKGSINIQGEFLNNSAGIRPALWITL